MFAFEGRGFYVYHILERTNDIHLYCKVSWYKCQWNILPGFSNRHCLLAEFEFPSRSQSATAFQLQVPLQIFLQPQHVFSDAQYNLQSVAVT